MERFKAIVKDKTGRDFPQDPREQMDLAVQAVFNSWNADRAILYRRQERIPADLGTAVNIVAMVFGNLGMDSGTGVAFTRDPGSGQQGVYGDYLQNAQGEDVVAGIRNTVPLQDLERIDAKSYAELMGIMSTLENHYKDLCDIEFTIERGKLWMLQTRVGQAHRGGGVPDRHPARRPGPDRHGRGADQGDRQPARPADVPAVRRGLGRQADHQGRQRLAGRGSRQGCLRLGHRGRVGGPRRARHPGPARDESR